MIGASLTLNAADQEECRRLAKERFANNRSKKVRNAKVGPQSNEFTDLEGIAGEYAFCRIMGLEPDKTVHVRSSKSDSGDANWKDLNLDIKTTKYPTGKLIVVPWKDHSKVDGFVLMVGTFPHYEFKGALSSSEMLQQKRLGTLGYGETYIATQEELVELERLPRKRLTRGARV